MSQETNEKQIDILAKKLWDYGLLRQKLKKADAIIVFGSYNPIVGQRAAELHLQGYAPIVVFSGNRSDSTTGWEKTEAETIADEAMKYGLPKDKILLETQATNSGDNIRFTKELLSQHGINLKTIIAIQKPYALRRAFAALRKQWPEIEVVMNAPQISFEEYMATSPLGKDKSIGIMVGDTQRIKLYAEKGYQIPQVMPDDVWDAYQQLVKLGYTKSLVKED